MEKEEEEEDGEEDEKKISIYLHVGEEIKKQKHEHQIQVCCSIDFERFVLAAAEYPAPFFFYSFIYFSIGEFHLKIRISQIN